MGSHPDHLPTAGSIIISFISAATSSNRDENFYVFLYFMMFILADVKKLSKDHLKQKRKLFLKESTTRLAGLEPVTYGLEIHNSHCKCSLQKGL